ncbi:MAG: transposase [Opitutales bacterium]|nr:transposase [Opitutales bacterium]
MKSTDTPANRLRRIVVSGRDAVYHVVTRTAGQAFLFGAREKEMFRAHLRATALFCGVEVLTFCLLDNHVHLLIRIPGEKPELTDEELLERSDGLYGGELHSRHALTIDDIREALAFGGEVRERMRAKLIGRMCDLPMFVKLLKQRFSIWYNRTHDRHGTLWSGRFTSILVEGKGLPVAVVAAYIDLNAVRAGIVDDPAKYRWCGYAEAVAGVKSACAGLHAIAGGNTPADGVARYGVLLYYKGRAPGRGKPRDARIPPELMEAVCQRFGSLTPFGQLRARMRYATQGAILGTAAFIESWFQEHRSHFGKRRSGPRKIRGGDWDGLHSFRDLQSPDRP